MSEVSSTRLYLGNLPRSATKQDIEEHFSTHGTGKITDIKLMSGFGFIEYEDAMDARDIVPAFHGSEFKGERLTVQFARGPRHKENFSGPPDRNTAPRPRRTIYRMQITGIPNDTSWQDLKDFARQSGQEVVYSETGRGGDGKGFVEFENSNDLKMAIEKLDSKEFKNATVHCTADVQEDRPDNRPYRTRSPPRGRGYGPPMDEYDRRGPPPRAYSPRGYARERSPRRGPEDYYGRDYGRRSPPRPDPYGPPPPRRYDYDQYDSRGLPPPPRGGYPDPYRNGDPYARPRSPPRAGYGYGGYGGYDDRRHW